MPAREEERSWAAFCGWGDADSGLLVFFTLVWKKGQIKFCKIGDALML